MNQLFKTISLDQFGQRENAKTWLKAENRTNCQQKPRTNNWQNLQMVSMRSGFEHPLNAVRIGSYFVCCANEGVRIGFPWQTTYNGWNAEGSPNMLNYGAVGVKKFDIASEGVNSETFVVTYTDPASQGTIKDYNIASNVYHDVLYKGLTPTMSITVGIVTRIKTYKKGKLKADQDTFELREDYTTPEGDMFEIDIKMDYPNPTPAQTWLLFLEGEGKTMTWKFGCSKKTEFTGTAALVNTWIRSAIVQDTLPPLTSIQNPDRDKPQPDWSTAAEIQTIAPTAVSMYTLWPKDWVSKVANQIYTQYKANYNRPICSVLSLLLPVMSRTKTISGANKSGVEIAKAILDQFSEGTTDMDDGTNKFLTYFTMLLANKLDGDIASYQTANRTPRSYSVKPSAQEIRETLIAHRHAIPLSADITYSADGYAWTFEMYNNTSDPLVSFLSYRSLDSALQPATYICKDPIKGDVYAAVASGNKISFTEGSTPEWYPASIVPPQVLETDFFNSDELTELVGYFDAVKDLDIVTSNSYYEGKQVWKFALTAEYACIVLSAQGKSATEIQSATQPLIDKIKAQLNNWLYLKNPSFPNNYFVGDQTNGGICAFMPGLDQPNIKNQGDFLNSCYNDQHFHYGYWLGAMGLVAKWDKTYCQKDQWIAQSVKSQTGQGPYKKKYFADMLWRATRNPDKNDPDLCFNRYQDAWECHGQASGFVQYTTGRNEESLAEDFNSWFGTQIYAYWANQSEALNTDDKSGFDTLLSFCDVNLRMTATGGKLFYRDNSWIYPAELFGDNIVIIANQWDTKVDGQTWFPPGTPACTVTLE